MLAKRCPLALVLLFGVCARPLLGSPADNAVPRAAVEAPVGMEGTFLLRYQGPRLEVVAGDDRAAVVVRIDNVVHDQLGDVYELRFIGDSPGSYDLRRYLRSIDGRPLDGVEPIRVVIRSSLPEDHSGELLSMAHPALPPRQHYRVIVSILAVLWLLPAFVWCYRRLRRRVRPAVPAGPSSSPSLADRLRPLAQRAIAGQLSQQEKASLERMLIHHWRDRLDLQQCSSVSALRALRQHEEAGQLLRQLDRWLHRPGPTEEVDLEQLLAPYSAEAVPR